MRFDSLALSRTRLRDLRVYARIPYSNLCESPRPVTTRQTDAINRMPNLRKINLAFLPAVLATTNPLPPVRIWGLGRKAITNDGTYVAAIA